MTASPHLLSTVEYEDALRAFSNGKTILFVVATDIEREALMAVTSPIPDAGEMLAYSQDGTQYFIAMLGEYACVVAQCTHPGNSSTGGAAQTTRKALTLWKPSAAFLSGIACGNPLRTRLNDVVISDIVVPYEPRRITPDSDIPYGHTYSPIRALRDIFAHHTWDSSSRMLPGAVLSGEKLIDNEKYRDRILACHGKSAAIEMEATGFVMECEDAGVPWLVIKAISDYGDGKKNSLRASRTTAADSAAQFCCSVFTHGNVAAFKQMGIRPHLTGKYQPALFSADRILHVLHGRPPSRAFSHSANGIIYEYVEVESGPLTLSKYLFLGARINVKQTFEHLRTRNDFTWEAVVVVGYRIAKQLPTVERRLAEIAGEARYTVVSLDELLWNYATPPRADGEVLAQDDFIDQVVTGTQMHCSTWFKGYLRESTRAPAVIVAGKGGVGKTWLCNDLERLILSVSQGHRKRSFVRMDAAHLLTRLPSTTITSLVDLYKHHLSIIGSDGGFPPDTFAISVSVGNVVVIIDGLDELAAAPGFDFDLHEFMHSLAELNLDTLSVFGSTSTCRVVATVREIPRDWVSEGNIERIALSGFSAEDVTSYITSTFDSERLRLKARHLVEQFGLSGDRFLPLALKLICEQLRIEEIWGHGDDDEGNTHRDASSASQSAGDILLAEGTLDQVVYGICNRETDRKSLTADAESLVEFYALICDEYNGECSFGDAQLAAMTSLDFRENETKKTEKLIEQNIFLEVRGDRVAVQYEPLIVFFQARSLLSRIKQDTMGRNDVRRLASVHKGKGALFVELQAVLQMLGDPIEIYQTALSYLRAQLRRDAQNTELRRAISGLLYLWLCKPGKSDRTTYTEQLIALYGDATIRDFYVWGPFVPLDFRQITVRGGELVAYENLYSSRAPEAGNRAFFSVPLKEMDDSWDIPAEWRGASAFDAHSHLESEALGKLAKSAETEKRSTVNVVVGELLRVLARFFSGQNPVSRSRNHISRYVKLRVLGSPEKAIKLLCQAGVLVEGRRGEYEIAKPLVKCCRDFVSNRSCPSELMDVVKTRIIPKVSRRREDGENANE